MQVILSSDPPVDRQIHVAVRVPAADAVVHVAPVVAVSFVEDVFAVAPSSCALREVSFASDTVEFEASVGSVGSLQSVQ